MKRMGWLAALAALALFAGAATRAGERITMGTNAEFPPFEYVDENANIVGFDVDMFTAVAKIAGYNVKVVNQAFDTLVQSLVMDQIDVVAAGMTITEERLKKVDFSDPYYNAAQVIVVKEATPGFTKIEDIVGKRVAVQLGTTGATMAEEQMGTKDRNLRQFRKYNEAFTELSLGRVDCVVVDSPVAAAYVARLPGLRISSPKLSEEQFGFAVSKKRPELLAKINAGLAQVRESGEYDQILAHWFGENAVDIPNEPEEDGADEGDAADEE